MTYRGPWRQPKYRHSYDKCRHGLVSGSKHSRSCCMISPRSFIKRGSSSENRTRSLVVRHCPRNLPYNLHEVHHFALVPRERIALVFGGFEWSEYTSRTRLEMPYITCTVPSQCRQALQSRARLRSFPAQLQNLLFESELQARMKRCGPSSPW